MDKLRMQSADGVQDNIKKIGELFPDCVEEALDEKGNPVFKVDWEKLRQNLSDDLLSENEERYQFTWPDKRKAILAANAPINATLRPCREESVDFDNTQNLYIEGDNLDVLKCLKETYLHKVKMIYIDPPYNTGNDFVYEDDFAESSEEYLAKSGQFDNQGNRLVANTESNGRFHTDWLNMIYPRLKVARDLLTDDGVIFISIDDNEQSNLKKVCDEIFGETNFIGQCVRKRRDSQANLSKNISPIHEYIVIYAKNSGNVLNKVSANIDEASYSNPDNDPRGDYVTMPCTNKGGSVYTITTPSGTEITDEWRFKKETYDALFADNRLVFPRGGEGKPRYKLFLAEKILEGQLANTWLDNLPSNQEATREVKSLFNDKVLFDMPKPVGLLSFCVQLATNKDSIILDFFSGSATTAHAIMKLNAEDSGNRKFILVQLPELIDPKKHASENAKKVDQAAIEFLDSILAPHNICEIGKERIRRAGKKIKEEFPLTTQNLDTGFRVLKLDSTNMEDVYYAPSEIQQSGVLNLVDNVKADRKGEDLLFQVMLELGATLDSKIEVMRIGGKTVYNVAEKYLVACFDEDVTDEVVEEMAKMKPQYAVLRDTSMKTDSTATNFDQIFKTYSPDTIAKIL